MRALLAEDNEANQMVAVELLSRLGIELDIADNGRKAVEMARANPGRYAAILMDMQMPEMDGLEATRVLRADPAFPRPADHRDDRQRHEARSRRLPGRRHERPHHQADRPHGHAGDAAALAAAQRTSARRRRSASPSPAPSVADRGYERSARTRRHQRERCTRPARPRLRQPEEDAHPVWRRTAQDAGRPACRRGRG